MDTMDLDQTKFLLLAKGCISPATEMLDLGLQLKSLSVLT